MASTLPTTICPPDVINSTRSPTSYWSSNKKKKPVTMSRTTVCEPKAKAAVTNPAGQTAGATLTSQILSNSSTPETTMHKPTIDFDSVKNVATRGMNRETNRRAKN